MAQASLKLSVLLTGLLILEAQLWVTVPWVYDGKKKSSHSELFLVTEMCDSIGRLGFKNNLLYEYKATD